MVCLVLLIAARKWARIGGTVYTMKNKGRRQLDPFAMLYPAQSIAALDIHLDLRAIQSCEKQDLVFRPHLIRKMKDCLPLFQLIRGDEP